MAAALNGLSDGRFNHPESARGHMALEIIEEIRNIVQFSNAGLDRDLPWNHDRDQQIGTGIGENRSYTIGDLIR